MEKYIKKHKIEYEFKPKKGEYRKLMFDTIAECPPQQNSKEI